MRCHIIRHIHNPRRFNSQEENNQQGLPDMVNPISPQSFPADTNNQEQDISNLSQVAKFYRKFGEDWRRKYVRN